jgi:amino-acid N-acetyltransferase
MREASPYLRAHRGQTFVVYLGGDLVAGPAFPQVVQDLALLSGIGVKLVVVHGARPQVEERLERAAIATTMAGDLRVTDSTALVEVKLAVAAVRYAIEAQFAHATGQRVPGNSGVRILGGNFVVARPAGIVGGVDLQFTGELRKIDIVGLRAQLEHADLVLLSPLGHSPTGELFSLNALELATVVAGELAAGKLPEFQGAGQGGQWMRAHEARSALQTMSGNLANRRGSDDRAGRCRVAQVSDEPRGGGEE